MRTIPNAIAIAMAMVTTTAVLLPAALRAQSNGNGLPRATTAQTTAKGALASIDSMIAQSRLREASAALTRWQRERGENASSADRATALMLRARLTQQGDSARSIYGEIALGYPSSPEAPVALLRLGQFAVANNDAAHAVSYFQRIIDDYPGSPVREDAVAWLSRTKGTTTNAARANTTTKPNTTAKPNTPASTTPSKPDAYTLQIGAFKEPKTAAGIVQLMIKRGFDARVAYVPGSSLARVRVGRFPTSKATDEMLRRLRNAGYEAVVVDDARLESDTPKG